MTPDANQITPTQETKPPVPFQIDANDATLGGKVELRDIAVPMLYVLQPMSPQVLDGNEARIPGALPSMLYLSVLEEIYAGIGNEAKGLDFVPCFYERKLVEWKLKEKGGGFIAAYPSDHSIQNTAKPDDKNRLMLPNGHQLVETAYRYLLVKADKSWVQCIMPMKSTALKYSRRLGSMIQAAVIPGSENQAPSFLYIYKVKTVSERNDMGTWYSPVFERSGMVDELLYRKAKDFAIIAAKGILQVREEKIEGDSEVPF